MYFSCICPLCANPPAARRTPCEASIDLTPSVILTLAPNMRPSGPPMSPTRAVLAPMLIPCAILRLRSCATRPRPILANFCPWSILTIKGTILFMM